jgi:phosphatidate cytidylyltransferase
MNNLGQRVITAVILVVLLLGILFLAPPVVAKAMAAFLFLLGGWEWSRFLGWTTNGARGSYALLIFAAMLLSAWLAPARLPLDWVLAASLAWWAAAFFWILRFPTPIPPLVAGLAGFLVLIPAWLGLVALLDLRPGGPVLVLFFLAIVWSADIGAYFVGRRIGRVRLAPRVSPGKTWEGVGGGLLAAVLAAVAGALVLGLPPMTLAAAGLSVAGISVVGDLTESMFKRNVGVKDSGRIFPGHGGVLDRMDSITAAVPLYVLAMGWLGKLPA